MKKAMAAEILKFFAENGKKDFADSFQELCIDCGIFMANDKSRSMRSR